MKTYKITLEDIFSFSKKTKEVNLTEAQANKVRQDIEDKRIVHQSFNPAEGIHWNYKCIKLETI